VNRLDDSRLAVTVGTPLVTVGGAAALWMLQQAEETMGVMHEQKR
jgi:hypothetical protein